MPAGDTSPTLIPSQGAGGPRCERLTDPSVAEQEPEEQRFFRLCEVWVIAETLFAVVRGFRPTLLSVMRGFGTLLSVVRGFGPLKRRITVKSVFAAPQTSHNRKKRSGRSGLGRVGAVDDILVHHDLNDPVSPPRQPAALGHEQYGVQRDHSRKHGYICNDEAAHERAGAGAA